MKKGRKVAEHQAADPKAQQNPGRSLTLIIMCKNEAHRIQNALKSAKDIVDAVLIYDTGSTDGTIEKVLEICPNAEIQKGKFVNFVDSYNEALKHVRTSHVLMLAADEALPNPETARAIRQYFDAGGNLLDMTVKDFDAKGGYLTEMVRNRLFPQSKAYAGPYTHEYIKLAPGERADRLPSHLYVYHCPNKTKEQERSRMEQDIVALKQYLSDNRESFGPDVIRANFYLHKAYTVLEQYEQAKPYADIVRGYFAGQNHLFVNQIDFDECHTAFEKTRDLDVWRRATQRNPSCPALAAMYGVAALEAGAPDTAKESLRRAIALPRNEQTKLLADNPTLCLEFPVGALAEISHREGNILETSMYLNLLAAINPAYCEQLRNKLITIINW